MSRSNGEPVLVYSQVNGIPCIVEMLEPHTGVLLQTQGDYRDAFVQALKALHKSELVWACQGRTLIFTD